MEAAVNFKELCETSDIMLKKLLVEHRYGHQDTKFTVKLEPELEMSIEILDDTIKTEQFGEALYFDDDFITSDHEHDLNTSITEPGEDLLISTRPKQQPESTKKDNRGRVNTRTSGFQCDICQSYFSDRSTLNRHRLIHFGKQFKCTECNAAFNRRDKLKLHMRKYHEGVDIHGAKFECEYCNSEFFNKIQLRRHFDKLQCPGRVGMKFEKGSLTTCSGCGLDFTTEKGLKHHLANNKCGEEKPNICNVCNCVFSTRKALLRHEYIHAGNQYGCDICLKTFIRPDLLTGHRKKEHNDYEISCDPLYRADNYGRFVCQICEKLEPHPGALKDHYQQMHPNMKFQCYICRKNFMRRYELNRHVLQVHNGQPEERPTVVMPPKEEDEGKSGVYVCETCGKEFTKRYKYKDHIIIHSDIRKFLCNQCGAAFKTKTSLTIHEVRHGTVKPFKCEDCGKAYFTKSALAVHTRTHTGEKPYQCSECGASYTRSDSLAIHLRKHTGERPHACEYCPKRFAKKEKLKIHTRIHTG